MATCCLSSNLEPGLNSYSPSPSVSITKRRAVRCRLTCRRRQIHLMSVSSSGSSPALASLGATPPMPCPGRRHGEESAVVVIPSAQPTPLLRRFHLDRDGREPGRQVRYLGIGQRLGDDAHDFVGALATTIGLQLLCQIDLRLPREIRSVWKLPRPNSPWQTAHILALARPAWTSACAVPIAQASTHASAAGILCPVIDRVSTKRGTGQESPARLPSGPAVTVRVNCLLSSRRS